MSCNNLGLLIVPKVTTSTFSFRFEISSIVEFRFSVSTEVAVTIKIVGGADDILAICKQLKVLLYDSYDVYDANDSYDNFFQF